VVLLIVAVVVAAAGVVLVVQGLQVQPPAAAALPSATYSLSGSGQGAVVAAARASAAGSAAPRFDAPDTLYIPSLGVTAHITAESVTAGSLDIPRDPTTVGMARGYASLASASGTTLIAGHVTYDGVPGALEHLADTEPGALVVVTDAAGTATLWAVTAMTVRDKTDFPILATDGPHQLVVVTCGGPANRIDGAWHFQDNIIVTAVPAS